MLILPEKIIINILDGNRNSFTKANILIGIRIFANSKNNIEISPFSSDEVGRIVITNEQLLQTSHEYIKGGLMDYVPLNSAKAEVDIFVISLEETERRIKYFSELVEKFEKNKIYLNDSLGNGQVNTLIEEVEESKNKAKAELQLYTNSQNKGRVINSDIIKAIWDGKDKNPIYNILV